MFANVIETVKRASGSVYALWVLGAVSFLESALLPIPVDPVALPIMFSNRKRLWQAALIASVTSVAGGVLGYYIGSALYNSVGIWVVNTYGLGDQMLNFQEEMNTSAAFVLFVGTLSPLPYKLVAIGSGIIGYSFPIFFIISAIGRGIRFFCMALLIAFFDKQIIGFMGRHSKSVTILIVLGTLSGFFAIYFIG